MGVVCLLLAALTNAAESADEVVQRAVRLGAPVDVSVGQGEIRGYVVDSSGRLVPFALVALIDESGHVVRAQCQQTGAFAVPAPEGRTCLIAAGEQAVSLRLWRTAAPPNAAASVALVADGTAVRGEDTLFGFNPVAARRTAIAAAAVVAIAIAVDDGSSAPASP